MKAEIRVMNALVGIISVDRVIAGTLSFLQNTEIYLVLIIFILNYFGHPALQILRWLDFGPQERLWRSVTLTVATRYTFWQTNNVFSHTFLATTLRISWDAIFEVSEKAAKEVEEKI